MTWPVVEWSFVMGALCWVFVRMWTDRPFDRRRQRGIPNWVRRSVGAARKRHVDPSTKVPVEASTPGKSARAAEGGDKKLDREGTGGVNPAAPARGHSTGDIDAVNKDCGRAPLR
jgi:hypothetical protein